MFNTKSFKGIYEVRTVREPLAFMLLRFYYVPFSQVFFCVINNALSSTFKVKGSSENFARAFVRNSELILMKKYFYVKKYRH